MGKTAVAVHDSPGEVRTLSNQRGAVFAAARW
jgi:hypothetical protein